MKRSLFMIRAWKPTNLVAQILAEVRDVAGIEYLRPDIILSRASLEEIYRKHEGKPFFVPMIDDLEPVLTTVGIMAVKSYDISANLQNALRQKYDPLISPRNPLWLQSYFHVTKSQHEFVVNVREVAGQCPGMPTSFYYNKNGLRLPSCVTSDPFGIRDL